MKTIDIVLIIVIALIVSLALRNIIIRKRSGTDCGCGCEGCTKCCKKQG